MVRVVCWGRAMIECIRVRFVPPDDLRRRGIGCAGNLVLLAIHKHSGRHEAHRISHYVWHLQTETLLLRYAMQRAFQCGRRNGGSRCWRESKGVLYGGRVGVGTLDDGR